MAFPVHAGQPGCGRAGDHQAATQHNVDHFMHACRPAKLREGKVHPDPIVETLSLAAVEPPDPNYQHTLQVGALCQPSASCVPFYLRMVVVCMQTLWKSVTNHGCMPSRPAVAAPAADGELDE